MLRLVTGAGGILVRTDDAGVESVAIPGLRIPTDRNAQMWINFSHYDPNRYVSVADVLDGRFPADRFDRRLVLLGTSAIGLRDIKTTPTDPAMSGVEVHAQVIENILSNSFLIYPNYAIGAEILAGAVASLIVIAVGPMLGAASILGLGTVVAASVAGGAWYLFTQQRLLLDASYPLLCAISIYFTLIFINYFREQMQRRRIRSAFGQYLAPSLVDQLAQSHETLVLGGEVRSMTIMFTDVRGFTTISETFKDDPQGLTSLMNSFLTPMTNSILDHKGTIDKYIGDAIMAFWNAPLHDPEHELNACRTALDLLKRVQTLNEVRQVTDAAAGRPFIPLKMGIGLNSGPCVVGNMGSDLRFNYSVLGDPVNLASRLEGQTKNYGLPIIIGSRTAAAATGKLAVLELDRITVKGKTEPEAVFTLVGAEEVAAGDAFRQMTSAMQEFLQVYRAMNFDAAAKILDRCREAGLSFKLNDFLDIYEARLEMFRREPPPADWNGVMVLDTK
jgi:adenylate cyclase